ncbi:MAG: DMT family transporter [Nocardioidaceae bacterium]
MTRSDARRLALLATLALLGVTATWGSTFFLTKDLVERVPVPDYLFLRFLIATGTMVLIFPQAIPRLTPAARRHAVLLGVLYGTAQLLQTFGLARTPATVAGFITGMYVVLTPVFAALILKHRIGAVTWGAVALAVVGLGVLTLSGFSIGYGEALVLVSAALYALHIVGLGAWSTPDNALGISILQLATITVVCLFAALPHGVTLPSTTGDWSSTVYMAVIAGAGAMLGQTWAQAHLAPTQSALIMSMEPVFAALFAVWFGGESFTERMLVGGACVLAAMLIVELVPGRKIEGEVTHLAG